MSYGDWLDCCNMPGPLHLDGCPARPATRPVDGTESVTGATVPPVPYEAGSDDPEASGYPVRRMLTVCRDLIAAFYLMGHAERDDEFLLSPTDEYGWGDGESPWIGWESGPYEWSLETLLVPRLHEYVSRHGYRLEPVNGWSVQIYKEG